MKARKLRKSRRFAQTQVTPGRGTPPLDRQTWAPGKIRALNGTRCIERGVSTRLARGLLFFSRRRRRFVLGMRRALTDRLRRPLTRWRILMMGGRRGWPAHRGWKTEGAGPGIRARLGITLDARHLLSRRTLMLMFATREYVLRNMG